MTAQPGAEPNPVFSERPPLSEPLYKRVIHEIRDDDVLGQAAKVAYFMFTSLPPALLVLFALGGFVGGPELGDFLTGRIETALPGSADDPSSAAGFLARFIEGVVTERAPGPLSTGLVLGLWAASAVIVALADALNRAFDLVEKRSWLRKRAIALAVMIGFVVLLLGGSLLLIVGPELSTTLGLGRAARIAWTIFQWPIAFTLVAAGICLLYYVLPNRKQSDVLRSVVISSAIATAMWVVATFGFRIYISNFGSYGATYGFVGAILVLLLWMYITAIVILVGGEIASEMSRGTLG